MEVTRFGRYELLGKIAAGGMGEVFRAQMTGVEGFHKPIALKRIYPHLSMDKTYRTLFIQEAKVTASLIHPNIVQVYDLGEQDGQLFLAMEFVKGADLSQISEWLLRKGTTLTPDIAAVVAFVLLAATFPVHASHAWSTYHWATKSHPIKLITTNSMTSAWQPAFNGSISEWSKSSVLDFTVVAGSTNKKVRRRCNAKTGQIIACNLSYGGTGWLGIAGPGAH